MIVSIGRNIRRIRIERGYSQTALAERACVTQGWISRIETTADENPTLDSLERIARALGVDMKALLAEREAA